jgi:hypothetical protein
MFFFKIKKISTNQQKEELLFEKRVATILAHHQFLLRLATQAQKDEGSLELSPSSSSSRRHRSSSRSCATNKARTFLVLRKHTLMLKNTFEKGCLIKRRRRKKKLE